MSSLWTQYTIRLLNGFFSIKLKRNSGVIICILNEKIFNSQVFLGKYNTAYRQPLKSWIN